MTSPDTIVALVLVAGAYYGLGQANGSAREKARQAAKDKATAHLRRVK